MLKHISYFESITFCHISGLGGGLFMLTPDVEGDVMAVAGFEDFAVLASSEGWIDVEGDVMCVVSNVGSYRWVGGRALGWGKQVA